MAITCTQEELISRLNSLTKLLKPILPTGKRIAASRYNNGNNRLFILGAHVSNVSSREDYRQWFFKTLNPAFNCNYFEQWILDSNDYWIMKCAYLNLYYEEAEVLALHCDPNETKGTPHYTYKIGPHLHIEDKRALFSSAHIALNLINLNEILSSLNNLELAFSKALEMIRDQFITT